MNSIKPLITLTLTLFITNLISAQEIISSAGNTDTAEGLVVNWAVGEIVTTTDTVKGLDFTQGYAQPFIEIVSVDERNETNNITVSLFPNPATAEFNILFNTLPSEDFTIRVIDLRGREVKNNLVDDLQTNINVSDLLPATYIVEIFNQSGTYFNKIKFIKTH